MAVRKSARLAGDASIIPTVEERVWEAPELRRMIFAHLKDILRFSWRSNLVKLITLDQASLVDVASLVYEDAYFYKNPGDATEKDLLDYLYARGCPIDRMKLYTSCIQRMAIESPLPKTQPLLSINQARILATYPNLRTIAFRFDTPADQTHSSTGTLTRHATEQGFAGLSIQTAGYPSSSYNINSLFKDTVNPTSGDRKYHLESVRFLGTDYDDIHPSSESNPHTWFYTGMAPSSCPYLLTLHLGETPVLFAQLRQILGSAPNLVDLEFSLGEDETMPDRDLKFLKACRRLKRLKFLDPEGRWARPVVEVLDCLLGYPRHIGVCPNLRELELPVTFGSETDDTDWIFVDGNPVGPPKPNSDREPWSPRWNLTHLTLKATKSSLSHVSSLALIYLFATAVPVHCDVTLTRADSELVSVLERITEPGGHLDELEEARVEERSRLVQESRRMMRREVEGPGWGKREVGWRMM